MYKTIANVLTFALRRRSTGILWTKFKLRLKELGKSEATEAREWAASKSEDAASFMSKLDSNLQIEIACHGARCSQNIKRSFLQNRTR